MKTRASHVVTSSVALISVLALSGCVSSGKETESAKGSTDTCKRSTEKTIAIDYPFNNLPLYAFLKTQSEARAKERGYSLIWTSDNGKLDAQVKSLESLTAQKVPAIVTLPLEPTSVESIMKRARANCTVVVSYASQLENEDSSIGLNLKESGVSLAENAVEWAEKQPGTVNVFILNNNDLPAGKLRYDGIKEGLAKAPAGKIKIVSDQKADSPQKAASVAQQVLQANPEITMVLGFNDDWALAALQAMRNLGRDVGADSNVYIGGMDAASNALEELKKNNAFRATVGERLPDTANALVDLPADILEGKKVEPVRELTVRTLTPGDPLVDVYLADLAGSK